MNENKDYANKPQNQREDGLEIDLMTYARKLWAARKLLLRVAGIAFVVGVVIALTTPKQYTVSVTLAPESTKTGASGLSSIASMLGVGGLNMGSDADALSITLYPDIVSSTPFILDLMDTPVNTMNEEIPEITLSDYLKDHTNKSLIGMVLSLPFKAINGVISLFKPKMEEDQTQINPFHLTKEQYRSVEGLRKKIDTYVNKKTGVTEVSVTMQDPMVAAILTDTVIVKLKEHITKYRISKAEEDCKYWEQLNEQRKNEYYETQKKYAEYIDANKNIILQSVRIEQERLQNEMNLAYQVYSNVATQLQMAKAKVQEAKPVFAVVEPASVPLKASGTSRIMVIIFTIFIAVTGASVWILFGLNFCKSLNKD